MELTINIDEKEFAKLLEGELKNFSEQELHQICRDALVKQLSDPEVFSSMFVTKGGGYYSYDKYYANDILKEAAKSVDLSPLFKDFQEKVIKYLEENHDSIIRDLMANIFMSGFSCYLYSSEFAERMRDEFSQKMAMMNEDNNKKIQNALGQL